MDEQLLPEIERFLSLTGMSATRFGAVIVAVGREDEREGLVLFDRADWIDPRAWRVEYGD